MGTSFNPSQRGVTGGKAEPVYIVGGEIDAAITANGAPITDANPMPVDDAGGSLSVDDAGGSLSIDDGGGSLTVDIYNQEGVMYYDAVSATDISTPAANTAAVITLAAIPGRYHYIKSIAWSYDSTPAQGSTLTITSGIITVFHQYVTAGGPGFQEFPGLLGLRSNLGVAVVITLSAGGAGVSGSLSLKGSLTP